MKKIILLALLLPSFYLCQAQEASSWEEGLGSVLMQMQDISSPDVYLDLSNNFDRIASEVPDQWLPVYYSALAKGLYTYGGSDKGQYDALLDEAIKQANGILNFRQLKDANAAQSEVYCLLALLSSAKIGIEPMSRGAKFGPLIGQYLTKAEELDANNPRVYFLQAQNLYYTPPAFGGDKRMALVKIETCLQKFQFQSSAGDGNQKLMPTWGMNEAKDMLNRLEKELNMQGK